MFFSILIYTEAGRVFVIVLFFSILQPFQKAVATQQYNHPIAKSTIYKRESFARAGGTAFSLTKNTEVS